MKNKLIYISVEMDRMASGELEYHVEAHSNIEEVKDEMRNFKERHEEDCTEDYSGDNFIHCSDDEGNRFSFTYHEKYVK